MKKTGHNLKFDMLHLRQHGLTVAGVEHDTMIMSYLLFPNRRSHQLKELSAEFLGVRQTTYRGTGRQGQKPGGDRRGGGGTGGQLLPRRRRLLRAAGGEAPAHAGAKRSCSPVPATSRCRWSRVLLDMEWHGIGVDCAFLTGGRRPPQRSRSLPAKRRSSELAGYDLNLNSPQQLAELLFDKMDLPLSKKTRKTKAQSTDIDVLNELKGFPDRGKDHRPPDL